MRNDDDMRETEAEERKATKKDPAGDVDDLIFHGEPKQRASSR